MVCHKEKVVRRDRRNVEDGLGDSDEDPVDDAGVDHAPLAVTLLRRGRRPNVTLETELAECGVEEAAPLAIIGLVDVQRDGDMGADGDHLEDGGRRVRRRRKQQSTRETAPLMRKRWRKD